MSLNFARGHHFSVDSAVLHAMQNKLQLNMKMWKTMYMEVDRSVACTPSVPNYRSFDFFNLKFDHSSYSKK